MANLLPSQIPPESIQWVLPNGRISHTVWLFLYNMAQQVLGTDGSTAAASSAFVNADLDSTVNATDALTLFARVSALEQQQGDLPDPQVPQTAQEGLLQDPVPRAPPAQVLTPGVSPWAYTALQDGWLILSDGTVSAIALSRDGTTFYATGLTAGVFPMSRLDAAKVTYSGTPTATYFPR